MRVIKNQLLGTWELAESSEEMLPVQGDLEPADSKRILLVDDEARIRELYSRILAGLFPDSKIDAAADGMQAINLFTETHHACVLLDYVMPYLTGEDVFLKMVDLCKEKGWQRPSFVFFTGSNPPQSLHNAVAGDPSLCLLRKPVRAEILKEAVSARMKC